MGPEIGWRRLGLQRGKQHTGPGTSGDSEEPASIRDHGELPTHETDRSGRGKSAGSQKMNFATASTIANDGVPPRPEARRSAPAFRSSRLLQPGSLNVFTMECNYTSIGDKNLQECT